MVISFLLGVWYVTKDGGIFIWRIQVPCTVDFNEHDAQYFRHPPCQPHRETNAGNMDLRRVESFLSSPQPTTPADNTPTPFRLRLCVIKQATTPVRASRRRSKEWRKEFSLIQAFLRYLSPAKSSLMRLGQGWYHLKVRGNDVNNGSASMLSKAYFKVSLPTNGTRSKR